MNHTFFSSEFFIYKISQANNLYIAIPKTFARFIRECVMEYQDLLSVPSDKRVRGILLNTINSNLLPEQLTSKCTDIAINRLRFDF